MKKFVGVCISVVAVIGLSSCGGDDGGIGSANGSGDVQKVVDALISYAAGTGLTLDEACVADAVDKLSAADLTLVVDNLDALGNGLGSFMAYVDISSEGIGTLMSTADCITAE
jgi:hypothetical protein